MSRLIPICAIFICLSLGCFQSGEDPATPQSPTPVTGSGEGSAKTPSPTAVTGDPYVGVWVRLANASKVLSIQTESGAYLVRTEGCEEYDATKSDGIFRLSTPIASIDVVYIGSSDHLMVAGEEYRRLDQRNREEQRVVQKLTMDDMRTIAHAWNARAQDFNSYSVDGIPEGDVSYEQLAKALWPVYGKRVPRYDVWGTPFMFRVFENGNLMSIRSLGSNRQIDEPHEGETISHAADILLSGVRFVSYPKGEIPEYQVGQQPCG